MSSSRWKLMAGALGLSLGGFAAIAGQCPKPDATRSAGTTAAPSSEPHRRPEGRTVPLVPPTGTTTDAKVLPLLPLPGPTPLEPQTASSPAMPPLPDLARAGSVIPASGTDDGIATPSRPESAGPASSRQPSSEGMTEPPAPSVPPASMKSAAEALPTLPPPAPTTDVNLPPMAPPVESRTREPMPMLMPASPPVPAPPPAPTGPAAAPTPEAVAEVSPAVVKPSPVPVALAPVAPAPTGQKFRIHLRVGEGEPTFEVRCGDELVLKVACEKVDIKSPEKQNGLSAVRASGRVRFVGFGSEGSCDELSFLAGTGEVTMTGNVTIQVKDKLGRVESELTTESVRYRIDPCQAAGPKP